MVSKQQSKILQVLKNAETPMTTDNISTALNTSQHTARTQLYRLLAERHISRTSEGLWVIGATTGHTSTSMIDVLLEEIQEEIHSFVLGENNVVSLDPDWSEMTEEEKELIINDPKTFFSNIQARIQDAHHILDDPFLSILSLPDISDVRALGADQKGRLVMVEGDVSSYRPVERRIIDGAWMCQECQAVTLVHYHVGDKITPPAVRACKHGSRPLLLSERCLEEDEQWFILEESLYEEAVKPAVWVRVPCWLVERMAEGRSIRVGNKLRVVGIYRSYYEKNREGDTVPVNYIEASSFQLVMADIGDIVLSEEEESGVYVFKEEGGVVERLESLVAPHIYGMALAKRLTLLASVYGPFNEDMGRQNVNVLLLGHTGTAKSTLLSWWRRNYPRTCLTSGPGSTSAGLYGMALRSDERLGGRFTVIQGAIPRSHGGIALLDEIEKQIEISGAGQLHEALEHRRVSIDKGDAHTILQADCAVFMAANWKNMLKPDENTYLVDAIPREIPPTILSRCILINCDRLVCDEDREKISKAIIDKHRGGVSGGSDRFLINYLSVARRMRPVLTEEVLDAVERCFSLWEKQGGRGYGGIEITKRLLEDFLRLTRSSAMLHLREETSLEDVEVVFPIFQHMLEEFARLDDGCFDMSLVSGAVVGEGERRLEEEALRVLALKGGLDRDVLLADVPGVDVDRMLADEKVREVGGIIYRMV